MKKGDLISSVILFLVSLVYVIEARKLPMSDGVSPGAGFIPFWIGLAVLFLSIILFRKSLKTKSTTSQKFLLKKGKGLRDIAYITISLFIYLICIYFWGFRVSTFLFLAFLFKSVGRYGYVFSCGISLLATIALSGVFEYWLEMPFPPGRIPLF